MMKLPQARVVVAVLAIATCMSCRGVGGTYDHSRSLAHSGGLAEAGAVAVVGPPESAELPGLSETLRSAVREALGSSFPDRKILDQGEFYSRLSRHRGYFEGFGTWLARYSQTGFAETRHQPAFGKATGTRYLVLIRDARVRREKMAVRDALEEAGCGFGCVIADAKNIWGNRLLVTAEVHDLAQGEIVWKGVGEANAITSRTSEVDFGLVKYNLRQPGAGAYSDQLVSKVANGIAREISGS